MGEREKQAMQPTRNIKSLSLSLSMLFFISPSCNVFMFHLVVRALPSMKKKKNKAFCITKSYFIFFLYEQVILSILHYYLNNL